MAVSGSGFSDSERKTLDEFLVKHDNFLATIKSRVSVLDELFETEWRGVGEDFKPYMRDLRVRLRAFSSQAEDFSKEIKSLDSSENLMKFLKTENFSKYMKSLKEFSHIDIVKQGEPGYPSAKQYLDKKIKKDVGVEVFGDFSALTETMFSESVVMRTAMLTRDSDNLKKNIDSTQVNIKSLQEIEKGFLNLKSEREEFFENNDTGSDLDKIKKLSKKDTKVSIEKIKEFQKRIYDLAELELSVMDAEFKKFPNSSNTSSDSSVRSPLSVLAEESRLVAQLSNLEKVKERQEELVKEILGLKSAPRDAVSKKEIKELEIQLSNLNKKYYDLDKMIKHLKGVVKVGSTEYVIDAMKNRADPKFILEISELDRKLGGIGTPEERLDFELGKIRNNMKASDQRPFFERVFGKGNKPVVSSNSHDDQKSKADSESSLNHSTSSEDKSSSDYRNAAAPVVAAPPVVAVAPALAGAEKKPRPSVLLRQNAFKVKNAETDVKNAETAHNLLFNFPPKKPVDVAENNPDTPGNKEKLDSEVKITNNKPRKN